MRRGAQKSCKNKVQKVWILEGIELKKGKDTWQEYAYLTYLGV